MQSSNAPNKIQLPFAASGTKNTIPVPSQQGITPGAASFTDGFPPLTFTPLSAGGVPPAGADFNGVLNAITAVQQWQNAGGFFPFDASFASAIGGYPKGAMLLNATFSGLWVCTADNNTTNPDTGGAGWIAFMPHGKQIFTSSGTFNPPPGVTSGWVSGCGGGAGGGSGGGAAGSNVGSGGGGGGAGAVALFQAVSWGTSPVSVTIGAAGNGGAQNTAGGVGSSGSNGGATSFGSLIALVGGNSGGGGGSGSSTSAGGGGGNNGGSDGGDGGVSFNSCGGSGGGSPFGSGGGAGRGGNGGGNAGRSAAGYGSGGGGGGGSYSAGLGNGGAGGNGAPGIIIVGW